MSIFDDLFEIDDSIKILNANLVDDDGVIVPEAEELYDQLLMDREKKIENAALVVKIINYEIEALKEEKKKIDQRIRVKQNSQNWWKESLARELEGRKFETSKAVVSFRRSTQVQVDENFIEYAKKKYPELVRTKITETPDKTKIKEILADGGELEHCELITKQNINIR